MKGTIVLLATLGLALTGCGNSTPTLTGNEESEVAQINLAFAQNALDGSEYGEVLTGTEQLIRLCRHKRNAVYKTGRKTVKQVLEDDSNTIREYKPAIGRQLDQAVSTNCT